MNALSSNCCFSVKTNNVLRCASVALVAVVVAGCPAGKSPSDTPASKGSPSGTIVIKGSNTVGEELAPRLIAEYKKDHPKVSIALETKGTGSGFWGLVAGVCDIAAASRTINKDEQAQADARGIQIDDNVIGSYSVAVVVNAANPLNDLKPDQIRDIFIGAVQNWKDVGGPDAPIHLYIRDPVSGTYLGFRELAMENKPYATNNVTMFTDYSAIEKAVAGDPNGIGYSSLQLANKAGSKSISIGGVTAAAPVVKEGKYPLSRVLHLCMNKNAQADDAREFVRFVQSSRGQEILDQMGFTPRL